MMDWGFGRKMKRDYSFGGGRRSSRGVIPSHLDNTAYLCDPGHVQPSNDARQWVLENLLEPWTQQAGWARSGNTSPTRKFAGQKREQFEMRGPEKEKIQKLQGLDRE